MDGFTDLLLSLLVDGALYTTASRKVPLPLRFLLGMVLLVFFGGVIGLICWVGISSGQWWLTALGLFLLGCCLFRLWVAWKNRLP